VPHSAARRHRGDVGQAEEVNRAAPNAPSWSTYAVFVSAALCVPLLRTAGARSAMKPIVNGKPIAVAPDGEALLEAAGIPPRPRHRDRQGAGW